MSALIVVAALLALGGALTLYLVVERAGRAGVALAVLRAFAWAGVAALLVDPGCRHGTVPPMVLLDASLSMTDPGSDARWLAAVDSARRLAAGGPVVLFGERPVAWHQGARPTAAASRLLPALRDAVSRGGPVVIVTDGEVDDAAVLPADVMRAARVVVLPRPARPDAAVAAVRLPSVLAAGDTAEAEVDVTSDEAGPRDSVTVTLLDGGRVVVRQQVGLGGGSARTTLRFVPAAPPGERAVRRYDAFVAGWRRDADPRDDTASTAAAVTRAASVVLVSGSPDWDFRRLALTLRTARATPVRAFERVSDGPWLDAATLAPVSETAVRAALSHADLVVAHGPEASVREALASATHSTWSWPTGGGGVPGDWYVTPDAGASPLGGVLSGVPADSLPPLTGIRPAAPDSSAWTALPARAGRRGAAQPVVEGGTRDGRQWVAVLGTGLWRWAAKGGVAGEAYRALVLTLADRLLERGAADDRGVWALRDSLARGALERLPRRAALRAQPGSAVGAVQRLPLQQRPWIYGAVLVALSLEWIARRRRGMR